LPDFSGLLLMQLLWLRLGGQHNNASKLPFEFFVFSVLFAENTSIFNASPFGHTQ